MAIAVYFRKLARRRSRFIASNWKKGDRGLLSQIGKRAIAVCFCKLKRGDHNKKLFNEFVIF
jgi:hypothetical protein